MNDIASRRKTGGLAWSGTLQSLSVPAGIHRMNRIRLSCVAGWRYSHEYYGIVVGIDLFPLFQEREDMQHRRMVRQEAKPHPVFLKKCVGIALQRSPISEFSEDARPDRK